MIRMSAVTAVAALFLSACSSPQTTSFVVPAPRATLSPMAAGDTGLLVPQTTTRVRAAPQSVARPGGFSVAPPNAPSGPAVDAFARSFLNTIQARSIAERREYCGYIVVDARGQLTATPARRGTMASCDMPAPQPGQGIIASYHTHGAYDRGYDNEVPSVIDLTSDFQFGIDGYVATPGGRIWLVDYQTYSTRQVCGLGCVTSDPNFQPDGEETILPVFTLQSLQQRNRLF